MKNFLLLLFCTVLCFIKLNTKTEALAIWRQPQNLKCLDSENWCWLSVAQGLMSQVMDDVPPQTNLFIERIKTGGLADINSANGKGNSKDLETAINNYFSSYGFSNDVSACSFELFGEGDLSDKIQLVKSINSLYGAIGVLKGEHWLLIVKIYTDENTAEEKVDYMDTNGQGVISSNLGDFFSKTLSNGIVTNSVYSCCYMVPRTGDFRLQNKIRPTWPLFRSKNLWGNDIAIYKNEFGEEIIHTIRPDVEYDVCDSFMFPGEIKNFINFDYDFYVKGESSAPLDASGEKLELLTNKVAANLFEIKNNKEEVRTVLDPSNFARITIRGYEVNKFLTDFYFDNKQKMYLKSEDMGFGDKFLDIIGDGTFSRNRSDCSLYTTNDEFGAPVYDQKGIFSHPVLKIAKGKIFNVFRTELGRSFITKRCSYFIPESFITKVS